MSFGPLASVALSFVLLAAVFWPLERLFPAREGQRWIRTGWWTDLAVLLGQYLLWGGLALPAISQVAELLDVVVPAQAREAFASQPFGVQVLAVVAAGDLLVYWFHRACHQVPWLWRFHSVHHSSVELDWLAAHREHPVDGVLTQLVVNLPALVAGFGLEQIGWLVVLRGMWAIFIHSNVRMPLGPLRVLLGAPELHHWHHLKSDRAQNFANLAPWTDLLFGTYHCPSGPERWELGVPAPYPTGYLGMLAHPFRADPDAPGVRIEQEPG